MPDGMESAPQPTPQPAQSPVDFSQLPGHAEHPIMPAEQYIKNLGTQQSGEKQYSDWLYQNHPDEYKQASPMDYYVRKIHGAISDAAARGIEHDPEYLKQAVAPHVQELADFASGQLGIQPGSVGNTQGLATGTVVPEGGLSFDEIPGHQVEPGQIVRGSDRRQVSSTPELERRTVPRRLKDIQGPPSTSVINSLREKASASDISPEEKTVLDSQINDLKAHPEDVDAAKGVDIGKIRTDAAQASKSEQERKLEAVKEGKKRYGDRFKIPAGYEENEKGEIVESAKTPNGNISDKEPAIAPASDRAGTAKIKPTAVVKPEIRDIVEKSGGVYNGQNNAGLVEITLPKHMADAIPGLEDWKKKWISVTLPEHEVTPEAVKNAMDRKFLEMGGSNKAKQ